MILELIGKRLLRGVVTLGMISLFIFFSVELLPGDLAENILGQAATPESVAALRTKLGLDQPGYVRYWQWASGVFSGDLGVAVTSGRPVSELILVRIGNTFFLAIVAAATATAILGTKSGETIRFVVGNGHCGRMASSCVASSLETGPAPDNSSSRSSKLKISSKLRTGEVFQRWSRWDTAAQPRSRWEKGATC